MIIIVIALLAFAIGAALHFAVASLLFGSALFWTLLFVETCFMFWCVDDGTLDDADFDGALPTVSLIALLILLQEFSNVKPFTYLWTHRATAALFAVGYLVVGALWSVAKWWFVETATFAAFKRSYAMRHGDRGPDAWKIAVAKEREQRSTGAQRARALAWIAYWPWSMAWTLANDPLKRAARRIYDALQGTYQRITDRVWRTS